MFLPPSSPKNQEGAVAGTGNREGKGLGHSASHQSLPVLILPSLPHGDVHPQSGFEHEFELDAFLQKVSSLQKITIDRGAQTLSWKDLGLEIELLPTWCHCNPTTTEMGHENQKFKANSDYIRLT